MTEAAKTEQEVALEAAEAKAESTNATRSGKGTRVKVGQTRGRNPLVISFEQFDEALPDTLPKTLSEFMEVAKVSDEPTIVGYLIDGYNAAQYTLASDPVAEFVDPTWSDEIKARFRLVVRSYSTMTGVSIEDAVALLKPGIAAAAKK